LSALFDECVIRGRRFAPARFSAPLAGYTHSAFRRLIADLGGCGAVWTEMLAARQILSENFNKSPWLRRRPHEGQLVYQLMVNSADPIDRVVERLGEGGAEALDLNLACNARSIRSCAAGSALFNDLEALRHVLHTVRKLWPHMLTAKIRFGSQRPDWQARFIERLRLLEESGVDAIILHARFFEEKFKRRARHELFPWAASLTKLPLIANGDLNGPGTLQARAADFQSASGVMLGRMAIVQPWVFATWNQPKAVDLLDIWRTLFHYVMQDFVPAIAVRRMLMFAKYFSANFKFGHQFKLELGRARSPYELQQRAEEFFARGPALLPHPTVAGL
jgi:tRNA-dihydrouridine synthase B